MIRQFIILVSPAYCRWGDQSGAESIKRLSQYVYFGSFISLFQLQTSLTPSFHFVRHINIIKIICQPQCNEELKHASPLQAALSLKRFTRRESARCSPESSVKANITQSETPLLKNNSSNVEPPVGKNKEDERCTRQNGTSQLKTFATSRTRKKRAQC